MSSDCERKMQQQISPCDIQIVTMPIERGERRQREIAGMNNKPICAKGPCQTEPFVCAEFEKWKIDDSQLLSQRKQFGDVLNA